MATKKQASKRKPARAKAPTAAKTGRKKVPQRTNSGGKGGAREGAGRKKGAATVRTRAIADEWLASGDITPLEYMRQVLTSDDADLDERLKNGDLDIKEYLVLKEKRRERRDWAAEKAAPFVHPRLQATTVKGEGEDGAIPLNLSIRFV